MEMSSYDERSIKIESADDGEDEPQRLGGGEVVAYDEDFKVVLADGDIDIKPYNADEECPIDDKKYVISVYKTADSIKRECEDYCSDSISSICSHAEYPGDSFMEAAAAIPVPQKKKKEDAVTSSEIYNQLATGSDTTSTNGHRCGQRTKTSRVCLFTVVGDIHTK